MAKKEAITVKVEGSNLVITAPMLKPFKPSKSGKSLVVVTTHGNIPTGATLQGKPVIMGLNVYIKA